MLYAIQVKTGSESRFKKYLNGPADKKEENSPYKIFSPERELTIKRGGKSSLCKKTIFPGYIFMETDGIDNSLFAKIKKTKYFTKFLPDNAGPQPLYGKDLEIISRLINNGEIIPKSKVIFDENNKIRVLEGPLKGMEGMISKVDRRKCRAKVRLSLYENNFAVDFGFDCLEKINAE